MGTWVCFVFNKSFHYLKKNILDRESFCEELIKIIFWLLSENVLTMFVYNIWSGC